MKRLVRWFPIILKDRTKWTEAGEWFTKEYETGMGFTDIAGSLMFANQTQPGLVSFYDSIHSDLDAILKLFEQDLRVVKAAALRQFANDPPTKTKLTATELKQLVDAESDVVEAEMKVGEVKSIYQMFGSLMKGLDQRGYTLNNITKLRVAGMQEVEV